ncbi:hypothetical protein HYW30_00240 [Candidatus Azambacteria bacterium]|nr:hypothetical protein [Candidatus Azambacteria bacterium]MBI2587720.1 hypothetical protein [Candidatus Azambacteria bacterium]
METPFFSLLLLRMGVGALFFWAGLEKSEWILFVLGAAIFLGLFVKVAAGLGAAAVLFANLTDQVPVTALADALPSLPLSVLMILILAVLFFGRTGEFMGLDGYWKAQKAKRKGQNEV